MKLERKKGITWSGALHLLVFILLVAGLPILFEPPPDNEPTAITVEILPITGITNVKPSESKPAPKKEPEKPAEAKKPAPPVKTAEATPPPPPEKTEKKPEKKEEVKKPEEKKPEKKMKEEDLLAVLKAVKETASKEGKKNTKDATETSEKQSKSQKYDPSMPMSLSEKDAIKNQIMKCWTVPAGARDAHDLVIVLRVQYDRDGSYLKVELAGASKARYKDPYFRAAADSAIRAVRMCSPLKELSPEKYDTWRDMELHFDPREMLL